MSQGSIRSPNGEVLFDKHLFPEQSNRNQVVNQRPSVLSVQIASINDKVLIRMEQRESESEKDREKDERRQNCRTSVGGQRRRNSRDEELDCSCCECFDLKICDLTRNGGLYRNTFGPTIDETLLVGYETLCCTCNKHTSTARQHAQNPSQSVIVVVQHQDQQQPEDVNEPRGSYPLGSVSSYGTNDDIKNVKEESNQEIIDNQFRSSPGSLADETVIGRPGSSIDRSYHATPRPLPSPRYPEVPDATIRCNCTQSPGSPSSRFFDQDHDSNLDNTAVRSSLREWQSKQPFPTVEFKDPAQDFKPRKTSSPYASCTRPGRESSRSNRSDLVPSCQDPRTRQSNYEDSPYPRQFLEDSAEESIERTPSEQSQEMPGESEGGFFEENPQCSTIAHHPVTYASPCLPTIQEESEECLEESEKYPTRENSSQKSSLVLLYETTTESTDSIVDFPRMPTPRPAPDSDESSDIPCSQKSACSDKNTGIKSLPKVSEASEISNESHSNEELGISSISNGDKSRRVSFPDENLLAREREMWERTLKETEQRYEEFTRRIEEEYNKLSEELAKEQEERHMEREAMRLEFEQKLQHERELHENSLRAISQSQLSQNERSLQRRRASEEQERVLRRSSELDKERRMLIEQERRLEKERRKRIQLQQQMEREKRKLLHEKQKCRCAGSEKGCRDAHPSKSEKKSKHFRAQSVEDPNDLRTEKLYDSRKCGIEKARIPRISDDGTLDHSRRLPSEKADYSKQPYFERGEHSRSAQLDKHSKQLPKETFEHTVLPCPEDCAQPLEPDKAGHSKQLPSEMLEPCPGNCSEAADQPVVESTLKPERDLASTSVRTIPEAAKRSEDLLRDRNRVPHDTKYAVTRICKYGDFRTYEILKTTRTKPKTVPCSPEEVFTVKS